MWKTLDKLLKSEKKLPKEAKAREKTQARPLFTFQQPLPYHLNFSPQSMNTLWRIFMEKWDQSSADGPGGRKKRNAPQTMKRLWKDLRNTVKLHNKTTIKYMGKLCKLKFVGMYPWLPLWGSWRAQHD